MNDKFKNKYRIPSARLQNWDYGKNASYFITICTKNMEHFFGEIVEIGLPTVETQNFASLPTQPSEPVMQFTLIGQAAHDCWNEIPNHFPFVKLGEYVIMPNHVHGIITIDKPDDVVETQNFASLPTPTQPQKPTNKFGPQSQNLGSIVRGFKIGVTKFATANAIDFVWQPRFHEHIIRNEESYERIRNYIINNPGKWKDDKFYS